MIITTGRFDSGLCVAHKNTKGTLTEVVEQAGLSNTTSAQFGVYIVARENDLWRDIFI